MSQVNSNNINSVQTTLIRLKYNGISNLISYFNIDVEQQFGQLCYKEITFSKLISQVISNLNYAKKLYCWYKFLNNLLKS